MYETVKKLIEDGVIFSKGEGRTDDRQWLLIHTVFGEVVYKEFWTGPGLGIETEISTDAPFSEETLLSLSEATGLLWNEKNQGIPEPQTLTKVLTF